MQSEYRQLTKQYLSGAIFICIVLFFTGCNNSIIREGTASADSDLECRSELAKGTKVRRSLCLSEEKWAELDARADSLEDQQERDLDIFFRRATQQSGLGLGSAAPETPGSP